MNGRRNHPFKQAAENCQSFSCKFYLFAGSRPERIVEAAVSPATILTSQASTPAATVIPAGRELASYFRESRSPPSPVAPNHSLVGERVPAINHPLSSSLYQHLPSYGRGGGVVGRGRGVGAGLGVMLGVPVGVAVGDVVVVGVGVGVRVAVAVGVGVITPVAVGVAVGVRVAVAVAVGVITAVAV